jgi:hypothetical protein
MSARNLVLSAVVVGSLTTGGFGLCLGQPPQTARGAVPTVIRAEVLNLQESTVLLLFGAGLSAVGFAARRHGRRRDQQKRVTSDAVREV